MEFPVGSIVFFVAIVFIIRRILRQRRLGKRADSPPQSPLLTSLDAKLDATLPLSISRSMSQRSGNNEFSSFWGLNSTSNSNGGGFAQDTAPVAPASRYNQNINQSRAGGNNLAGLNPYQNQQSVQFPFSNGMDDVPPVSPLPQPMMGRYTDEEKGTPVFEMDNSSSGPKNSMNGGRYEDRSPGGTTTSFSLFPRQMKRDSLGKQVEPRDF